VETAKQKGMKNEPKSKKEFLMKNDQASAANTRKCEELRKNSFLSRHGLNVSGGSCHNSCFLIKYLFTKESQAARSAAAKERKTTHRPEHNSTRFKWMMEKIAVFGEHKASERDFYFYFPLNGALRL
jgi:hypothetical protein